MVKKSETPKGPLSNAIDVKNAVVSTSVSAKSLSDLQVILSAGLVRTMGRNAVRFGIRRTFERQRKSAFADYLATCDAVMSLGL